MINYQDIEDAIMGVVKEQLSYVKTTYDKLYTWQPIHTILKYNSGVWEELEAPGNSVWRWHGNPNDKVKSIFNPNDGDLYSTWIQVTK